MKKFYAVISVFLLSRAVNASAERQEVGIKINAHHCYLLQKKMCVFRNFEQFYEPIVVQAHNKSSSAIECSWGTRRYVEEALQRGVIIICQLVISIHKKAESARSNASKMHFFVRMRSDL